MRGSSGTTGDSTRASRRVRSVRLRLALMGGLVVLLLTAIVWIKAATWNRVREIQQAFESVPTKAFSLGVHLQASVWKLNGRLLRFQLSQEDAEREAFQREASDLTRWIAATEPKLTTRQERELVREAQAAFEQYLRETSPLLEQGVRTVKKDTASVVYQEIAEKSARLQGLCQQLVECQDAALAKHFTVSGATLGAMRELMRFSNLLLMVCTLAIAFLAYRVLVAPLRVKLSQTEQAVSRHEKLASLGTLAAGVAHEIRNPLTAIKFRLFSFEKELPSYCAEHVDLEVIHGEINRLERIVEDFLEFARPSEPHFVEIEVEEVLKRVDNLMRGSLERRGITLKRESPVAIKIRADPQQVEQVLINLVQNAADSIVSDGTITLRASSAVVSLDAKPQWVAAFHVTDTGKGVPPEHEQRIFDPFFSTKENGTGLGLAIASRIAEQHGGTIQYESRHNRDTTFSFVLPGIIDNASPNPPH